ncbi:hypothetical protein QD460_09855 [Rhizobium jaguaris]|uniref:hypothetical protein n=1 Tax=Rhizobium jaguaris TaxID=1312183 RepID=UPI0039BF6E52
MIVPALSTGTPEQLIPALGRLDTELVKAQLLKWHAEGAQIVASCIGTFFLAEAGLLDYRETTTTWWLAPLCPLGTSERLSDPLRRQQMDARRKREG